MKELSDEIKLTLNIMQTDVSNGAREELQFHLYNLLEMKRNRLHRNNPDVFEVATESTESKPLTTEELKLGGWWCTDVSEDCANAFESNHLRVFNSSEWGDGADWGGCVLDYDGQVTRGFTDPEYRKQIHRVGNEFYWIEE